MRDTKIQTPSYLHWTEQLPLRLAATTRQEQAEAEDVLLAVIATIVDETFRRDPA
jgi:hypothetical protein